MRRERGFTLIEATIVLGIVGILAAVSAFAFRKIVTATRLSGDRFSVMRLISAAKTRAAARGRDVYVIFADLDQTVTFPNAQAPRVIVYEDPAPFALRAGIDDILSVVEGAAPPGRIIDRMVSAEHSGLFFRTKAGSDVPKCDPTAATFPPYLTVLGNRRTQRDCSPIWCTFCEKQGAACVGAIRFAGDGAARVVTGPSGSGGLLRMVDRMDPLKTVCLVFTEPAGAVVSLLE